MSKVDFITDPGIIEFQTRNVKAQIWACCVNCINWEKKSEVCTLAKARPPAHVITVGCLKHEKDIPF